MSKMKLWGFDGSTYVRTVKMVLVEKQYSDFAAHCLAHRKRKPLAFLKENQGLRRAGGASRIRTADLWIMIPSL